MALFQFTAVVSGAPVPNALVHINVAGTKVPAPLTDNGGAPVANPTQADASGVISVNVADGYYDLTLTNPSSNQSVCVENVQVGIPGFPAPETDPVGTQITIDPTSRAFLEASGMFYQVEDAAGNKLGAHINIQPLIKALKDKIPGYDPATSPALIIDLIEAL